jgi:hypothetical protein
MRIVILFLLATLSFCTTQPKIETNNSRNMDCYNSKVIIWVHPTQSVLNNIENKLSEDELNTFEDDAGYYNTMAQSFLIEKTNDDFITDSAISYCFILKNEKIFLKINDNEITSSPWKIILFDGEKPPIVTCPVDLETTYNLYFNEK